MRYIIIIILVTTSIVFGQYLCPWSTVSVGTEAMFGTNNLCGATIGQTAIGTMASSNYISHIGFWQIGLTPAIMTDEENEITNINALVTKLYSAKPNPFKTLSAVCYSLSTQGKVSLRVFDISGKVVRTLVNEEIQPGIYNINWNGRNERNQKLSTGVYFYKLQTQNYTSTKKILLAE